MNISLKVIAYLAIGFIIGFVVRSQLALRQLQSQKQTIQADKTSNEFSIAKIRVGDKIADMRLVKIEPYFADINNVIDHSSNVKLTFSGKAIITGNYFFSAPMGLTDENGSVKPENFDKVCMSTEDSLKRLPKPSDESNVTRFCFMNFDYAKKIFGPVGSGVTTVLIDNYTINRYPSEVNDTAELLWAEK